MTDEEKEFHEDFRAINYPLSERAFLWLCRFNGIPLGYSVPWTWKYAPNAAVQEKLDRLAELDEEKE